MRSILFSFLMATLIIGGVEYAYRYTGGIPSIVPGKTTFEFKYRVQETKADVVVYVIGDSRVDWGFGDKLFTEHIKQFQDKDIKAVNAGLSAGSIPVIMDFILKNHPNVQPGIMIFNFSPSSFYHFKSELGDTVAIIKRQDILDHRIGNYLFEKVYTFGQKVKSLYLHFQDYRKRGFTMRFGWFSRTLFPEGFVNAKGRNNDGSKNVPDPAYYRKLFLKIGDNLEYYLHRKTRTIKAIQRAREAGWKVIMIRIPIGEEMEFIESRLPESLQPIGIAHEAGLYFKDYAQDPRTTNLPSDGSHLIPESARTMSKILAEDLSRWLTSGLIEKQQPQRKAEEKEQNGIVIRQARVDDKSDIFDVHHASIKNLKKSGLYRERAIETWLSSMTLKSYDKIFYTRKMVVAVLDGEIVGFGQFNTKEKAIDSLHVAPIKHGYAIRSKLLQALEEIALRKNIRKIKLFGSIDLISFYEHKSYSLKSIKKIRFQNETQIEYATMEKLLS